MRQARTQAAIFIDFENVYYFLRNNYTSIREEYSDLVVELIQRLRQHILEKYDEQAISFDAFADFERIGENAQSALYLRGIETHNVLGTEHKNAADMKLCIAVMETFYTRREIESFIVVAGDRDYIPVIRHLKKHGRTVRVVGFRQSISGDLLTNVGEEYFLDAEQFLAPFVSTAQPASTAAGAGAADGADAPQERVKPAPTIAPRELADSETEAMRILFRHYKDKPEVFLTPYLYKLRAELPLLSEWERKQLIAGLQRAGAIRVEKRHGEPNDYSVLLVNWNHPSVRAINPG
jgi:uncharacterized LabA/DUF88 family protein